MNREGRDIDKIQKHFLVGVIIICITLLFLYVSSILTTIMIAAIFVTSVHPLQIILNNKLKLSKNISALINFILIISLIVIPLIYFFIAIVGQASNAYDAITINVNRLLHEEYQAYPLFDNFNEWIEKSLINNPITAQDMITTATEFIGNISTFLLKNMTNIIKQMSLLVIHLIIFLFTLFFLIRDGDSMVDYVKTLVPLPEEYRNELFTKMYKLIHAIIYGVFGAALAQGFLLGMGFSIVGVNNAVFWGAIGALMSPLPYIGTSVVWLPVVITLFIKGKILVGVILLIWCIFIVGLADNLIKPYIIGSASNLHPLAVMLVIIGGALTFGINGLIFGPFILSFTLAFLHIYRLEFKNALNSKIPIIEISPKKTKNEDRNE